jgi:hypothetical protein
MISCLTSLSFSRHRDGRPITAIPFVSAYPSHELNKLGSDSNVTDDSYLGSNKHRGRQLMQEGRSQRIRFHARAQFQFVALSTHTQM